MPNLRLKAAGKCVALLAATCLFLAVASAIVNALAKPWLLQAYGPRYSFVPGHHFGSRLVEVMQDDRNTCIIVGVSTEREGLDVRIMRSQLPNIRIVNMATTGHNTEVLEIQTAILQRFRVRPRCIIVGFSLWMMFHDDSPPVARLTRQDYVGLMSWHEVLGLAWSPLTRLSEPRALTRLLTSLILPLRAQARQLNRVVRTTAWRLHSSLLGNKELSSYETYAGELTPARDFFYLGRPSIWKSDRDRLLKRKRPWHDANRYGHPEQLAIVQNTMRSLSSLTENIILLHAPRTSLLDGPAELGGPHVRQALAAMGPAIKVLDCSGLRSEDYFYDEGHLNEVGRALLSQDVARYLLGSDLGQREFSLLEFCRPIGMNLEALR